MMVCIVTRALIAACSQMLLHGGFSLHTLQHSCACGCLAAVPSCRMFAKISVMSKFPQLVDLQGKTAIAQTDITNVQACYL